MFCIQIPVEALHMKWIPQSEILQHIVLHPKKGLSKFRFFRGGREFWYTLNQEVKPNAKWTQNQVCMHNKSYTVTSCVYSWQIETKIKLRSN